jgi:hypothetical protein
MVSPSWRSWLRRLGIGSRSARPARVRRLQLEPLEQRQLLDGALALEVCVPVPSATGLVRELPADVPAATAAEGTGLEAILREAGAEQVEGTYAWLAADRQARAPAEVPVAVAEPETLAANEARDWLFTAHDSHFNVEGWLPGGQWQGQQQPAESQAVQAEEHSRPVLAAVCVPGASRRDGEEGLIAAQLFAGIALVCRQERKTEQLRPWRSRRGRPRRAGAGVG